MRHSLYVTQQNRCKTLLHSIFPFCPSELRPWNTSLVSYDKISPTEPSPFTEVQEHAPVQQISCPYNIILFKFVAKTFLQFNLQFLAVISSEIFSYFPSLNRLVEQYFLLHFFIKFMKLHQLVYTFFISIT